MSKLFLLSLLGSFQAQSAMAVSTASDPIQSCESLAKYSLENTMIINSTLVPSGNLTVDGTANFYEFCRVFAKVGYPTENFVLFEVWLSDATVYNGRFLAVGNSGMVGEVEEAQMIENLNLGFAVAGGNEGHLQSENVNENGTVTPGTYLPFLRDRNQILAWFRNSIAYFTPPARRLVELHYGQAARHSYFKGCSAGGGQAFALAQFWPDLFDGIIAGCSADYFSHLMYQFLWNGLPLSATDSSALTQDKLDLITSAVLAECDGIDGVIDGVLENPLLCHFDIESLACSEGVTNTSNCLTAEQIEIARTVYAGPRNSRTNESLYPGMSLGSETEWAGQVIGSQQFAIPVFQNAVFDDLDWDATTFDWAGDVDAVEDRFGVLIDSVSLDLSAFVKRGGKFLNTQGWADPLTAAMWPIWRLKGFERVFGGDVGDWYRLFMVPGGGHCGQHLGHYLQVPETWLTVDKMVDWVENGKAPDEVLSINPLDGSGRSRKLCPWPKTAKFTGGDPDDADSFSCGGPEITAPPNKA